MQAGNSASSEAVNVVADEAGNLRCGRGAMRLTAFVGYEWSGPLELPP
jgi:hypothetical protein